MNIFTKYSNALPYTEEEKARISRLDELMESWEKKVRQNKETAPFMADGAYPHYFGQNPRVLFIGREAYGDYEPCTKASYLVEYYENYIEGMAYGERSLNQAKFHGRLFYMMHAINTGAENWSDVPWAEKIAMEDFKTGKLSFAFMNLNKLMNISGDNVTDMETLEKFAHTYREETRKEIEILDPHIIVSANLMNQVDMNPIFGDWEGLSGNGEDGENIYVWRGCVNGHPVYLLDLLHFSAYNKPEYEAFYACVRDVCKKYDIKGQCK